MFTRPLTQSIDPRACSWSTVQARRIVTAARAAPDWGVRPSWYVGVHGRTVRLYASPEHLTIEHDFACGAALTNARLAVRTAGWAVLSSFHRFTDPPELLAELTAGQNLPPTTAEADGYAAILGLRRNPAAIAAREAERAVLSASWCAGVEVRSLRLTEALPDIARVPAAGPAAWNPCFLVLTTDDGRTDRVRAGCTVQSVGLTAAALGLGWREPILLPGAQWLRTALTERLTLGGFPQALLCVDTLSPLRSDDD